MSQPSESFKKAQKHLQEALNSLWKAHTCVKDGYGLRTSDVGYLLDSADSVMRVSEKLLGKEVACHEAQGKPTR